ncbi:dynein regulatory complex subunit 4 [Mugil cephalus]|uniref:dynein regulatory complex subunit 4 n=1 Tax=Mugil cephalus TaxID=48193 RepID=UPI001FB60A2D|nr:dynein regulatory complex subunit 4 [Mugil cephalus]
MPPKKKGASKKPEKARTPTLIDGLTKEEMSKEQLEEHIVRLREELDREREERNYFQLERDKVHTFWEITDRKLEELKAEKKNLDKDIEEDERRHRVEIKVYKQKMKHLLCEHQNTISELKAEGLVSTEAAQKEQKQLEAELLKKMRTIVEDTQELNSENLVKEMEAKHEEEMTTTRNNLERELAEIRAKNDEKIQLVQQELDYMRRNAISEIEQGWNSHIASLIEDHNKALSDANEIVTPTQKDYHQTTSLLNEISQTKQKLRNLEKELIPVLKDNKGLAELISNIKEEKAATEKKMKYFWETKNTIEKVKNKELQNLKRDHEILEQKFSKLQVERDELHKTFTENIQEVQDKADQKNLPLERKLQALVDNTEKTQAQLCSVLSASNMDQTALREITNKAEKSIDSGNAAIKNLQYKKNLISKARRDLLLTIESLQRTLRVPVVELSVNPDGSSLSGKNLNLDLDFGPTMTSFAKI